MAKKTSAPASLARVGTIIAESRNSLARLDGDRLVEIAAIADALVAALKAGHCVFVMGNGGSAADSQHFAAELVGRFKMERRALPSVAFTTDTSNLTAIGNDYGFDNIFVRQVEALVHKGDVVIGISTSGNSPNVVKAIDKANSLGVVTVGLTGEKGGKLADRCRLCFRAPGLASDRIQECHIIAIHALCQIIEERLFQVRSS